jgi:hypothetical protein
MNWKALGCAQACRWLIVAAVLTMAAPVRAQVNIDAYSDYFLVGRFGEVCTMCEVVVLCQAGESPPREDAVPPDGDFSLYHLQTRTFWSQMSTIWEWFISNFTAEDLAARGHTRPVHVYRVAEGQWLSKEIVEARLVLDPGILEFGDRNIDRISRAWSRADTGAEVGYCSRLPLWDALESIEANAPEGDR